jgi:hypothetical protein
MKITTTSHIEKPHVGQLVTVYGQECKIFAVHEIERAIDVVTLNGEKAWRISGLNFISTK